MNAALSIEAMTREQDRRISAAVEQEQSRLRNFIRRRVPDPGDAEDILQDVFYELVEAYRLMKPIEQVGAWLFRVARNRITDRFRKKKPVLVSDLAEVEEDGEMLSIEELPDEQREAFVAHEFEGRSFKELAAESGVSVNTLLSRKRYAVLYLRERLREIYDELMEG